MMEKKSKDNSIWKSFTKKNSKKMLNFPRKVSQVKEHIFLKSLAQTTRTFAQRTTLHGINHVGKDLQDLRKQTLIRQRIMDFISLVIWSSTCVLGIVFAVTLMWFLWTKFEHSPTIMTIETNNYPVSKVAFPTVSVCNINKVYAPHTKNLTDKLLAIGFSQRNITAYLTRLSRLIYPQRSNKFYDKIDEAIFDQLNYTTESLMMELMQPCQNMITTCSWMGVSEPCNSLFRIAKTADGFCCSFNSQAFRKSLEIDSDNEDVSNQITHTNYRSSGFGEKVGLEAFLHTEKKYYMSYSSSFYGLRVLINDAEDYPESSVSAVTVQPSYDVSISVIPTIILSSPDVRKLAVSDRNCLFGDEKPLRINDDYSFQSCMTECTINEFYRKCSCVPYYYPLFPLEPGSNRTPRQCTMRDVNCLRDNRHSFFTIKPDREIPAFNNTKLEGMECTCHPECKEQTYDVETIYAQRFSSHLNLTQSVNPLHVITPNYTTLNVFFKEMTCIQYRRSIFMSWDELFATFGGIYGLCLGGSVISLIELFYYFTFYLYQQVTTMKEAFQSRPLEAEKTKEKPPENIEMDNENPDVDLTQYGYFE